MSTTPSDGSESDEDGAWVEEQIVRLRRLGCPIALYWARSAAAQNGYRCNMRAAAGHICISEWAPTRRGAVEKVVIEHVKSLLGGAQFHKN